MIEIMNEMGSRACTIFETNEPRKKVSFVVPVSFSSLSAIFLNHNNTLYMHNIRRHEQEYEAAAATTANNKKINRRIEWCQVFRV